MSIFTKLFDELGNEAGPSHLVVGAEPFAGAPMKIFMEEDIVMEMGIGLKFGAISENRAVPLGIVFKNTHKTLRNLCSNIPQVHKVSRASGTLNFEVVAIVVVVFLERLDQKHIQGKPDRTAPIGVPSKKATL